VGSVDKCTVIALIEDGVICSCFLDEPCEHALSSCRRYALKDPSALASLESEVATLKAACAKKDEALDAAYAALRCLDSCFEKSGDQCVFGGEEKPCKAVQAKDTVTKALSLSPQSVAEQVEYARVGKAFTEWYGGWRYTLNCNAPDKNLEALWRELGQLIAKSSGIVAKTS
jgi:hypothetical protein